MLWGGEYTTNGKTQRIYLCICLGEAYNPPYPSRSRVVVTIKPPLGGDIRNPTVYTYLPRIDFHLSDLTLRVH